MLGLCDKMMKLLNLEMYHETNIAQDGFPIPIFQVLMFRRGTDQSRSPQVSDGQLGFRHGKAC